MTSPWMSKIEIQTILKYLNKDQTVLEFGCGGSTNFFCDYVKDYYSIEHNEEWFCKIDAIKKNNVRIYHVKRNQTTSEDQRIKPYCLEGLEQSSRYKDFYDYITYPAKMNTVFDVVLVDGRARPECAKFIKPYLNNNGYLFIHDYWDRKHYHMIESLYNLVDWVKSGQSLAVFQNSI